MAAGIVLKVYFVIVWLTLSKGLDDFHVSVRLMGPLKGHLSLSFPSKATVHDLSTAIFNKSGISEDEVPVITLSPSGRELSPFDPLNLVNQSTNDPLRPDAKPEAIFYLRRHQLIANIDYFTEADSHHANGTNSLRIKRNVSISNGYADTLAEIKKQNHCWKARRLARNPITRVPFGDPIAFVFIGSNWHETTSWPIGIRRGTQTLHWFDYQVSAEEIGQFMEQTIMMKDEVVLRQSLHPSFTKYNVPSTRRGRERMTKIRDDTALMLSQTWYIGQPAPGLQKQHFESQHLIFVQYALRSGRIDLNETGRDKPLDLETLVDGTEPADQER